VFRPLLPLIRRLHFYAGILIAPFLLVATVSGGLYALAPTAEQFVYRDLLHSDSAGPPHTIADQVAAVRATHDAVTVTAVDAAAAPGQTTRVYLADDSLGDSQRRTVFVDPGSARILGETVTYGSNGALPLRTWIDHLHRDLHLGDAGRLYSETAASWLWVVALGGLALWIARFRTRRRNTGESWWRVGTVARSGTRRTRTLNWHGAVGLWLVVGLVFLSATGLTWSRYAGENIAELRSQLSWQRPSLPTVLPVAHQHHTGAHPGGEAPTPSAPTPSAPTIVEDRLDAITTIARDHGVDGRVEISLPTDPSDAVTVTQTRLPWRYSSNAVAIDPTTLAVTAELPFASWSWPAKLTDWAIQLHMGILFGWVSALALVILAAALTTVIVRGYLMWWRRGPATRPGRAPSRGTWRTAVASSGWGTRLGFAALVATTAAVGWFVPLLGIPLAAFLVGDALIGRVRDRSPVR